MRNQKRRCEQRARAATHAHLQQAAMAGAVLLCAVGLLADCGGQAAGAAAARQTPAVTPEAAAGTVAVLHIPNVQLGVPLFSPDGKWLISLGKDSVRFWNTATWQVERTLPVPAGLVQGSGLPSDALDAHKRLLICNAGLATYDLTTLREVADGPARPPGMVIQSLSRDGEYAVCSGVDEAPQVYRVKGWALVARPNAPQAERILFNYPFARDGQHMAVCLADGTGAVYQISPWSKTATLQPPAGKIPTAAVALPTFSPDGKLLAGLAVRQNRDSYIIVWNTSTGKPEEQASHIPWDGRRLCFVAFTSDGKYLAVPGPDGKLGLWSTIDWKLAKEYDLPPGVAEVWLNSGGRFLAAPSSVGSIWVWPSL